jgi:hypothetical protein
MQDWISVPRRDVTNSIGAALGVAGAAPNRHRCRQAAHGIACSNLE